MAEDTHPVYLSPSELGSKDYWENYYARTLAHISNETPTKDSTNADESDEEDDDDDINDEDDPGTSWFSEHNAPQKVLHFLTRRSFPLSPRNKPSTAPSILDLGTGNGSMLALLQKKGGYNGMMVGVDYSAQSVELARELQRSRGHSAYRSDSESEESEDENQDEQIDESIPQPIIFEEWDILSSKATLSPTGTAISVSNTEETLSWFPYQTGGFDIVLDKGTFDAISLAGDAKETRVCERYPDIVRRLLRKGGFLMVTSCNWTEEELVKWFTGPVGSAEGEVDRLVVWGRVEYPRFRFGGQEGQGVCTVCFQRVVGSS
ncbi:S-adenosylmethionine-dependent methyltransferase [Penicillium herquei]|nr:S-adenosylmethionine-dependent methyltransferase [Penicillium herquei]